jgi:hypothetical protein
VGPQSEGARSAADRRADETEESDVTAAPVRHRSWLTRDDCDLDEFRTVVEVPTDPADYPHADRIERGVLFYGETLADDVATPDGRRAVQAELAHALMDGPGIMVFSTVDTERVAEAVYPTLRARKAAGARDRDLHNVVAAAAEGYPFPTNLDRDKPVGSLNPESQAQLVWRGLENDWDPATFAAALAAETDRRRSSLAR